ncbi:MAG: type II secretion system protein GspK [Gemmatales bacterium]
MTYHKQPRRKGAVLITVMVVIVVLLLIGYQYLNLMLAEGNASIVSGRLAQARHLADSGVHFANFVLAFPQTQNLSDSPDSYHPWYGTIYDNSDIFHYRPINGPNGVKGYFSIVSPRDPLDTSNSTGYRFGVEDEGGKINLNAVRQMIKKRIITKDTLLGMLKLIPAINEEQANAVINWTEEGGTPDSGESAYYSGLGYQSKAGPYDSLEELLMVKGWTPKQLFGNDKNRNGKLDPDEDDGTGQVDLGLQRYFTTYSRELNVDSTGQQKINLNNTDLVTLKSQLDAAVGTEISNFIILARSGSGDVYPNTITGKASALATAKKMPTDITIAGNTITFKDVQKLQSARTFDPNSTNPLTKKSLASLVNAVIGYRIGPGPGTPTLIASPLDTTDKDKARTNLALLFDKCTLSADYEIPARININTCPVDVLMALGLSETIAEKLIQTRPTPDMDPAAIPYYKTPAWLLTEAEIDTSIFTQFANYITTYSQVYRFQVVGYYEFRGPQVRLEVVVDANNGRPRILYWRDLTDLGKGYNFSTNRGGQ